jgi:hypothetical protein
MLPPHGPSDRHRSVKATHMHQKPHHHATSQCDKTGKVLDRLGGNAKSPFCNEIPSVIQAGEYDESWT